MTTGLVLWLLGQCHVKVLGSPPGVPGPLHKPFPSSDQEKNLAAIMSLGLPHSRSPGSGLCTAGSVLCFLPCSHYLPVSATTCPGSAPRCCCVLWPQAGPALVSPPLPWSSLGAPFVWEEVGGLPADHLCPVLAALHLRVTLLCLPAWELSKCLTSPRALGFLRWPTSCSSQTPQPRSTRDASGT